MEPRTTNDIIRDLLGFLLEREWVYSMHIRYEDDNRHECVGCDGEEKVHEENCRIKKLISETESYLRVEDELAG